MTITYFDGEDIPRCGGLFHVLEKEKTSHGVHGNFFRRATSEELANLLQAEVEKGRLKWAQLSIEIDDIVLAFWLPEEVETYCDVFAMTPFPTAKTLIGERTKDADLNRHWLSRLPKRAKSKKFRERFIKYVHTGTPEWKEFRNFYQSNKA